MEQSKIDMFIGTMVDKFLPEDIPVIKTQLEKLPDDKLLIVQSASYKNPTVVLVISLLLGGLGIDRFMLGQPLLGVLKLVTIGGFGILAIVDWFLVMKIVKKVNFQIFMRQVNNLQ